MATTDLAVRRTLDLTRAPDEQWNEEMVKVVAKNIFRGKEITQPQLYYCLNVAESLALNPLIGEIYFLPAKSRDGAGPAWTPYIGRNGLVKKAGERGAYYESDTVHENDKFTMRRKSDGTMAVTHSYGTADRGEIIGAYAFLHFRNGDRPSFFYAKLSEYLPEFDNDWKMKVSPWGNQRSAMIEKCFDADTEILTDRGFEPLPIAQGRVLQVTDRGLEPTQARPFWQPYDGPMVVNASQAADFAVTPNHDLVLSGGRMEAGEVYARARSGAVKGLAVVRSVIADAPDVPSISDDDLRLAGYYVADGTIDSRSGFTLNVARPRKIAALRALGGVERKGRQKGDSAGTATATLDHVVFRFPSERLPDFLLEGKRIDVGRLIGYSPRQVRIFVEAWLDFDGDRSRRLYCTRPDLLGAFEAAAVHAGYSVSSRRSRLNLALSPRPNYTITVSGKMASPLLRGGRDGRLRLAPSDGRGVWCVNVPSSTIVVRRRGFSMICSNCAMIGAGRKRLDLGNVLIDAEGAIVEQMNDIGPHRPPAMPVALDFSAFTEDPDLAQRLKLATGRADWPQAKIEMILAGRSHDELEQIVERAEQEATNLAASAAPAAAESTPGEGVGDPSPGPESATEGVTDAEIVPDSEHAATLRARIAGLEQRLETAAPASDEYRELSAELDAVQGELDALENPDQPSLL